jgi:hypothetical protein
MLNKINAILLGVVLLFPLGCATSGPDKGKITPQSAVPAVKTATYLGTALTIREKPDVLDEFQMVHKQLVLLEAQKAIDWTSVVVVLNNLPVKELRGTNAQLIISSGMVLLNTYANGALDPINKHIEDIHLIVKALREGIELGITDANIK